MVIITCEHEASINHFCHPHPLQLSNLHVQQNLNQSTICSACEVKISVWMYSCKSCNFFLHTQCSKIPEQITHPYHKHVLDLLPKAPYLSGGFLCDACGNNGNGFVYNCKGCERDLHIGCAALPMTLYHSSHPHELELTFDIPFFICDICAEMEQKQWFYWCRSCDFTVHLCCMNRRPVNSLPGRQPQPSMGINPGLVNPFWNHGTQPGQFVTPNLLNPFLGHPAYNQVPQSGYYMTPGVAAVEEYQRMVLEQAFGGGQNRAAIDMLQSIINGGGNGIGIGPGLSMTQAFGGGGGGGGGLDMLQGLFGGGGMGTPGLDIGGLGGLLGGLGSFLF